MTTTEPDLTIAVYSQDGACTEFYQNQEMSIKVILDQTLTPRLFAQPLLKFSSERGVSWYASRIVDMIKLKTTAIAPLVMPPGLEDIAEVNRERFAAEETPGDQRHPAGPDGSPPPAVIRAHVEIHTAGAWVIYLRLLIAKSGTIQDQRYALTHLFNAPIIPFLLEAGGIGIINPSSISRMSLYPGFAGIPQTALPADLVRWIPGFARQWEG